MALLCLSLVAGFLVVSSWSRKHNKFERTTKNVRPSKKIRPSYLFNFVASLLKHCIGKVIHSKKLGAMPSRASYQDILYTINTGIGEAPLLSNPTPPCPHITSRGPQIFSICLSNMVPNKSFYIRGV